MLGLDDANAQAQVAAYYCDAHVRARLREFCGAEDDGPPSAVYVAGFATHGQPYPTWSDADIVPAAELESLAEHGCDLSRSLWDTRALIFLIDLDYQNLDYPGEPFTHTAEVFFKLERSYSATLRVLRSFGIHPLTTATGRGYHLVGRVPLDQPVVAALASLGDLPAWYGRTVEGAPGVSTPGVPSMQAAAWEGLGLVTEFLAHHIVRRAEKQSVVPVVLNGTTVGSGLIGRECVSIDFSHVGDPLEVRHVRLGFSAYQWHRARPDIFGASVAGLPPIACPPRVERSLEAFIRTGRTLSDAARVAKRSTNGLPDVSEGIEHALSTYRASTLAEFHRTFAADLRGRTSARDLDLPADLPPCIVRPLVQPNDLLLKPEYLQNLVRGLLARGWPAARIARLVAREYVADRQWGDRWTRFDPQTRANFDVRVFAGLVATGVDRLVDFNCTSSQEKGVCPRCGCAHDLRLERDQLLMRFTS